MNDEQRSQLVGDMLAKYGVKIDKDDPMLMVVDMCAQVLDSRLEQLGKSQPRALPSGRDFAQAITEVYASTVLPKLQAVVQLEIGKALAKAQPQNPWYQTVLVGLVGVVIGALIVKL